MQQVIRAQYRAALREGVKDEELMELLGACKEKAEEERKNGRLLTGAMFRYRRLLFLYMEYITTDSGMRAEVIPDEWFADLSPVLYPNSKIR
jgi:hypothetical protein